MWGFMKISVMELQMNLIAENKQKEHWKISILFLNLTHGIVSQRKATEESDSLCHLNPPPSIIQARPHNFHPYPSVTVPPIVDLHNRVILLRGTLLMLFQGSKSHFLHVYTMYLHICLWACMWGCRNTCLGLYGSQNFFFNVFYSHPLPYLLR